MDEELEQTPPATVNLRDVPVPAHRASASKGVAERISVPRRHTDA